MNIYLQIIDKILSEGIGGDRIIVVKENSEMSNKLMFGINNEEECIAGIYVDDWNDQEGITRFTENEPEGTFIGNYL